MTTTKNYPDGKPRCRWCAIAPEFLAYSLNARVEWVSDRMSSFTFKLQIKIIGVCDV